jgi:hypothetical protein
MSHKCQSNNPATCRFHGQPVENQLENAVRNNDYAAYEEAKKQAPVPSEKTEFVHDAQYRNIKKMPALFVIDRSAHLATTDVNEPAAWIFNEASRPTYKKDGTSITVAEDGTIYARRAVKKGKKAPPGFIPAETDSYTGHTFGLEPIHQSGFAKMFDEAVGSQTLQPGTYELCGPKINGNPESLETHQLMPHGSETADDVPDMRTVPKEEAYETLKKLFSTYKERGIEGVVWWGANGKRTKLRVNDFFGDPHRSY